MWHTLLAVKVVKLYISYSRHCTNIIRVRNTHFSEKIFILCDDLQLCPLELPENGHNWRVESWHRLIGPPDIGKQRPIRQKLGSRRVGELCTDPARTRSYIRVRGPWIFEVGQETVLYLIFPRSKEGPGWNYTPRSNTIKAALLQLHTAQHSFPILKNMGQL